MTTNKGDTGNLVNLGRQLAGIQAHKSELEALGATIIAGSVDAADKIAEAAPDVTYPIAVNMMAFDLKIMPKVAGSLNDRFCTHDSAAYTPMPSAITRCGTR